MVLGSWWRGHPEGVSVILDLRHRPVWCRELTIGDADKFVEQELPIDAMVFTCGYLDAIKGSVRLRKAYADEDEGDRE